MPTTQHVSDLAWAGRHGQAIELATTALAAPGLSAGRRLDLLDLRAESFIAQGDLGRAAADADAISGHGGIVTLMMGDGLMSVFGAPLPLPDHAGSAVRAALEMVELVELFNVERTSAQKPTIRIGIGIASGEMVAGYAGTNERATYTCIGNIVNLASRLETHTKVVQRGILIDDATRSALGERITVKPLGPVPFKGKAAAVDVFSVDPAQKY